MISIAVIGDVHDERRRLDRVLSWLAAESPDLALLVGDVGLDPPWNEPARHGLRGAHDESVRGVLARVRQALGCPAAFVPGNHDLADPVDGLDAVNCDRRIVELGALRVAGFGGAGPARFGFPYEWDEDEAERALEPLTPGPGGIDVALFHAPPADTRLDRIRRGEHVGSGAVRRFLAAARPRLFVCGHIHEAWGLERVEGVPCLNAGALGEPYGQEIGWIVHWEEARPSRVRSLRASAGESPRIEEWPASAGSG